MSEGEGTYNFDGVRDALNQATNQHQSQEAQLPNHPGEGVEYAGLGGVHPSTQRRRRDSEAATPQGGAELAAQGRRRLASGGEDAAENERRVAGNVFQQIQREREDRPLLFEPQENQARSEQAATSQRSTDRDREIQATCDFMDRKLNSHAMLEPFLWLAIKTKTLALDSFNEEKFKVGQGTERTRKVRPEEAYGATEPEVLSKEFKFTVPPLGTFQTIKPGGLIPDLEMLYNPVKEPLTTLLPGLGVVNVQVDIELPLPRLKRTCLSVQLTPTHMVTFGCLFLTKGFESARSQECQLYYLPAGYFRRHQVDIQHTASHLAAQFSFTPSSGVTWFAFYNRAVAWYFYNGEIYLLPEGYLLMPALSPVNKPILVAYSQAAQREESGYNSLALNPNLWYSRLSIPDKEQYAQLRESFQTLLADVHVVYVARFHARRLGTQDYHLLMYFLVSFSQQLRERGLFTGLSDNQFVIEMLEVLAHRLQMWLTKVYYGPAPPLHVLSQIFKTLHTRSRVHASLAVDERRGTRNRAERTETKPPESPLSRPPPPPDPPAENPPEEDLEMSQQTITPTSPTSPMQF